MGLDYGFHFFISVSVVLFRIHLFWWLTALDSSSFFLFCYFGFISQRGWFFFACFFLFFFKVFLSDFAFLGVFGNCNWMYGSETMPGATLAASYHGGTALLMSGG